uniref:Uncharacterized protein n=1 Tax=Steinernema glaseri TaxID=37863 RepID=A0A1I7ZS85_9BILA
MPRAAGQEHVGAAFEDKSKWENQMNGERGKDVREVCPLRRNEAKDFGQNLHCCRMRLIAELVEKADGHVKNDLVADGFSFRGQYLMDIRTISIFSSWKPSYE